jgi:biopolymer transport protein TolR
VTLDSARRAMRAAYQREIDALDANLAGLATVGSVSPYIGLFGTVWGIMNAFRGLANVSQATLANVAPASPKRSSPPHRPVRSHPAGDRLQPLHARRGPPRDALRDVHRRVQQHPAASVMRRQRKAINQINVVPYIDVMLVLLIIFMVTAPLISPGEIELPSVGSKLTGADAAARGHAAQRQHDLASRPGREHSGGEVTRDELIARVRAKQAQQEQPVVIAADKNARYDDVLTILDLLQRNGVKKVGLLAKPPQS